MKSYYTILASLILISSIMFGQTIVSPGNVSGTWTVANSPYIVTGNINVSTSLLIQPGVTVKFQAGGWGITIGSGAQLVAKGNTANRIIFEPYQGQYRGSWKSVYFENSGSDDTLSYCTMRYGTNAISTNNSKPFINECSVNGDSVSGISMTFAGYSTTASVSNCKLYDNRTGIYIFAYTGEWDPSSSDTVIISGCLIYSNQGEGIIVNSSTHQYGFATDYMIARISNCTVTKNSGIGISVYASRRAGAEAALMNSIVAQNGQYGIANGSGGIVTASNLSYNCFKGNSLGNLSGITLTAGFGSPGPYRNANGDSCDLNFNIYYDPLFVNPSTSDFRLQYASKCIDAGTPIVFGKWVMDPDATLPDLGSIYYPHQLGVTLVSPSQDETIHQDSVQFVWNRCVPVVQHYWLELGTDSMFSSCVIDSTITDTTKTLKGLIDGVRWWRVKAKNNLGWGAYSSQRRFQTTTTDVRNYENIPSVFGLFQNYPNPFNPSTDIKYSVGTYGHTSLRIYDMIGREVAILVNENKHAGSYQISWNASNLPSGVYFYRLQAGSYSETKKLILLR